MNIFSDYFHADFIRYGNKSIFSWGGVFSYLFRKSQISGNLCWRGLFYLFRLMFHLEISPKTNIGKGLYVGHPYGITINAEAVIGENCNIHKGVTIGQENRGKRKGVPTIGNRVWIGINAVVVGKITIGNDVLIAPLAYVNFDVPDHSIVIGNPGKIIPRENATEGYINRTVQ